MIRPTDIRPSVTRHVAATVAAGNGTPVKSTSNAGQVYGGSVHVIV